MSDEAWRMVVVAFGLFAFHLLFIVAAALWEKRPIQPYSVPEPGKEYAHSPLGNQAYLAALQLGYRHGGLCHDNKSRLYRVRYDFWISPNNATIAVVGSGTVGSIPVYGIWLWSRLMGDRILCTTNEIGEQEISGAIDQQTWPRKNLYQLVEIHEKRLATDVVEPFPVDQPMAGYFDIRRAKANALVAKGYARFIDEDRTIWKYTLKGALVFYAMACWVRPALRLLRSVGVVK